MNRAEFFSRIPPMPQDQRTAIQWAYNLRKMWHKGQVRDDGGRYSDHPREVAVILLDLGYTDHATLIVAQLHDILEDTWMMPSMLEQLFGPAITGAIVTLSKSYGLVDPKTGFTVHSNKRTTEEYFRDIRTFGKLTSVVKCADRIHNLQDLTGSVPEGSRWTPEKRLKQVRETQDWIMPLAKIFDARMAETLQRQCSEILLSAHQTLGHRARVHYER